MSILIKGVEMPKEGTVFVIDSTGQVWSNEWPTRGYTRLDGVTAVSVPPHGRLIDADALRQSIKESIDECNKWADEVEGGEMYARVSQSLGTFVDCSLRVKAAPTIIQADRGAE